MATQMRTMAAILRKKMKTRKVIPRLMMNHYVARMADRSATVPLN